MKHVHKRLTYANVMSSIAVFLVLGGGAAFAALKIPANSVGTPQLKKNAVKTGKVSFEAIRAGKLSKNAVPTNRLRDNAVATEKIAGNAVTGEKVADNAVTTDKIAGEAVTTGKIAPNAIDTGRLADEAVTAPKLGSLKSTVVTKSVPKEGTLSEVISCPASHKAISGGYFTSATGDVQVTRFRPNGNTEWAFSFRNNSTTSALGVDMHIYCLAG